jgi:hypothetical protein
MTTSGIASVALESVTMAAGFGASTFAVSSVPDCVQAESSAARAAAIRAVAVKVRLRTVVVLMAFSSLSCTNEPSIPVTV